MTTENIELANWIYEGISPITTDDFKINGYTIGNCIPSNFESYCKLFHPFEINPDDTDILKPNKEYGQKVNLTFSKDTETGFKIKKIGQDGQEIDILELQKERLKEYNSKNWIYVTWKSIADKYGLFFHNEINPQTYVDKFQKIGWQNNLNFPSEGYLPRTLLVKLLNILSKTNYLDEVYIYQIIPHK